MKLESWIYILKKFCCGKLTTTTFWLCLHPFMVIMIVLLMILLLQTALPHPFMLPLILIISPLPNTSPQILYYPGGPRSSLQLSLQPFSGYGHYSYHYTYTNPWHCIPCRLHECSATTFYPLQWPQECPITLLLYTILSSGSSLHLYPQAIGRVHFLYFQP